MSSTRSNKKTQFWCLYGAYAFAVLFLLGWVVLAKFVPPLSPAADAGQTAAFYQGNLLGIRIGMLMSLLPRRCCCRGAARCARRCCASKARARP